MPSVQSCALSVAALVGCLSEGAVAIKSTRGNVAQDKDVFKPEFLFCEEAEDDKEFQDCREPGKSTHLVDLSDMIGDRMQKLAHTPIIMHIGANTFGPDSATYRPLLHKLSERSISAHVVLVDANPAQEQGLIKNVPTWLDIKEDNLEVVNAAISATCPMPHIHMYQWNATMLDLVPGSQRPAVEQEYHNMGLFAAMSSDRDFIVTKGNRFRSDAKLAPLYEALDAAGNMSSYIKDMPIDCHTGSTLLSKIHAGAADLAVLTIDVEGGDVPLLMELLKDVNFNPSFLRLEVNKWDESIAEQLLKRGYKVGEQNAIKGKTGYNMVAILPNF